MKERKRLFDEYCQEQADQFQEEKRRIAKVTLYYSCLGSRKTIYTIFGASHDKTWNGLDHVF